MRFKSKKNEERLQQKNNFADKYYSIGNRECISELSKKNMKDNRFNYATSLGRSIILFAKTLFWHDKSFCSTKSWKHL